MESLPNELLAASRLIAAQVLWASLAGGIFVGVLWAALRVFLRALSPAAKAALWWCAALKLVLDLVWLVPIPIAVLPATVLPDTGHRLALRATESATPSVPISNDTPSDSSREVIPAASHAASSIDTVRALVTSAALFWLVGVTVSFGLLIRRARLQAALVRRSQQVTDESVPRMTAKVATLLHLRTAPTVRMSDEIDSPFVTGVIRPTVLLPTALWSRLSDVEREIAICHECIHVQRRDLWFRWIPAIAERAFFFLPLARWAAREYVLCNEASCDARVLGVLATTPHEYGNVLLAFGVSQRDSAVLAGASSSFPLLKRRIAMLATPTRASFASRALAAASVILSIVFLTPVRPVARSTTPASNSQQPVAKVATSASSTNEWQKDAIREPDVKQLPNRESQQGVSVPVRSVAQKPHEKTITEGVTDRPNTLPCETRLALVQLDLAKAQTQILLQKLAEAQSRYQQVQTQYKEMQTRMSDQHPDVARMRQDMNIRRAEISSLQADIRDAADARAQQAGQPVPCDTRVAEMLSDVQQAQQRIQLLEEERRNKQTQAFLQAQLDAAQQQLAELQKTHTADHPDVVRTQQMIKQLQDRLAQRPQSAQTVRLSYPAVTTRQTLVVSADDVVSVIVVNQRDLSGDFPVWPDGTLTLPLIGRVTASGRTVRQVSDEITSRLRSYITDARVIVTIQPSQAQLEARLDAAQKQLAELQTHATPKQPEVVRMQRLIKDLQDQLAKIKK